MHSVDHEVMEALLAWLQAGETVHLATVLESYGSSPRPPAPSLSSAQAAPPWAPSPGAA